MLAPIAVFAFNRPDKLQQTLTALAHNVLADQSDVTIFCDGPRDDGERVKTDATKKIALSASGFASLSVIQRDKNMGLKNSVETGISYIFENNEQIIVVEDDIVTSKFFLQYMNDALAMYKDFSKVASISGYCIPHTISSPPETFFLRGGECWGWGTWKDRWKSLYTGDAKKMLDEIIDKKKTYYFDTDGTGVSTAILRDAADNKVSSWFMPWSAAICLSDRLTLHPSYSLVKNIGLDSGTHHNGCKIKQQPLYQNKINVQYQNIEESILMLNCYKNSNKKRRRFNKLKYIMSLFIATLHSIKNHGLLITAEKIRKHILLYLKQNNQGNL